MSIITQAQVEQYDRDGCLVVEGLVSPAEVEELRADAVRLCRGDYPCENLPPVAAGVSDEEATGRYLCLHQVHHLSPVMLGGVKHAGIAGVLSQIISPDVKCMQSMLFLKPPGFPGQAWHQDEIYIPTRDRSLCGAWIALDDATVENGCLWVLPGSQRLGDLYPQHDHGRPEEFDFAQESYGFDDAAEVPVECGAGAVVFFNGYLLHRSRKNRSGRFRRVLVNHYMSAHSLLPWHNPREGERMATADYRGVIMVAGEDPYAWKGYVEETGVWVRSFDPKALVTA
ncbi:MAG: phytanoyl-CoA dioxygenase family protein [Armatimonadetes bacterium]|nr:phytanoyl-CoA dioxygenase family protein [Armatimonadota bacterium]